MRRTILFLLTLLHTAILPARDRDSLLACINAVKLDPDCLYGCCVMSDEAAAVKEARLVLEQELARFIGNGRFSYLRLVENLPESIYHFITVEKRQDCFRALAYARKSQLEALEKELSGRFSHKGKRALDEFLLELSKARNIREIDSLIAACPADEFIRSGQIMLDTPQTYVDNGYLVFYDYNSDSVLEIMTPRSPSGQRWNLQTGLPTSPMKYRRIPIRWIYLDHKTDDRR